MPQTGSRGETFGRPTRKLAIRRKLGVILLILALASGLVLAFASVISEPRLVGEDTVVGRASSGTALVPLNFSEFGLIESALTIDICGVSFHFLTVGQEGEFRDSGVLPPPDLHCERTRASLPGNVAYFAVQSTRMQEANYTLFFAFFQFNQPYQILAFPSLFLLLPGSIVLIALIWRRALDRMVREAGKLTEGKSKKRKG